MSAIWETTAQDRSLWRCSCTSRVSHFEHQRISDLQLKREKRKAGVTTTLLSHNCTICGRGCAAAIELYSHMRTENWADCLSVKSTGDSATFPIVVGLLFLVVAVNKFSACATACRRWTENSVWTWWMSPVSTRQTHERCVLRCPMTSYDRLWPRRWLAGTVDQRQPWTTTTAVPLATEIRT